MRAIDLILSQAAPALNLVISEAERAALGDYAAMVMKWQRMVNLTGARTAEQFVSDHIVDALSVTRVLKSAKTVLDLGSGAGIPGIVIAIMRPDCSCLLLEPRKRRARFLIQVGIALGLKNISVEQCRGEDFSSTVTLDVVITRATGSLKQFLSSAGHLRSDSTRFIAMKAGVTPEELKETAALWPGVRLEPVLVPGFDVRNLVVFPASSTA